MTVTSEFAPGWASPPGETIQDILISRAVSRDTFGTALKLSEGGVSDLLSGNLRITTDVARELSAYFGNSVEFWTKRETQYRESLVRVENALISWVKKLPTKDMLAHGWILEPGTGISLVQRCLDFFGVPNLDTWELQYGNLGETTAFRASNAYHKNREAVISWLRKGQIDGARFPVADWDRERFAGSLGRIRALTRVRNPKKFLPELRDICASVGVQIAVVRSFPGCPVSGATLPVGDSKRLLVLSFRYLSDDQFWFTFFHEAGHLVLHDTSKPILEFKDDKSEAETEANQFATDTLIGSQNRPRLLDVSLTPKSIVALAASLGVSAGVVVGQLQHLGRIGMDQMNYLKSRFRWE